MDIDPETGLLIGPACPSSFPEYFIAGTQPKDTCDHDAEMMKRLNDDDLPENKTTQDQPKKNLFKSVLGIFR